MRKKSGNLESNLWFFGISFIAMIIMQVTLTLFKVPSYLIPKPLEVVSALIEKRQLLMMHSIVTINEAVSGLGISILLALIIGGIIYPLKKLKKVLYPFLLVSQTVPTIAVAPLILIWFGFGVMPKVLIVVSMCIFPILVSFLDGLDQVDSELIDLMKVMRADKKTIFKKCILPASLPTFFSGLKISATYAIGGAVTSEWLGAEKGLGIYMTRAVSSFSTDSLFAIIIVVVVSSLILFKLVEIVEEFLMPHKKIT